MIFYYVLQCQKFTYISSVFGSIAFKLYDLGQIFWASFHKLLTIVCCNCGPFLLTESLQTLTLLSISHFETNLVPRVHLSIWKTHLHPSFNFLADVLNCCFNISTWWHLFCEVHLLQQNITRSWSQAWKHPPFPPNVNSHYGQQFNFSFIRTQDMSPKCKVCIYRG